MSEAWRREIEMELEAIHVVPHTQNLENNEYIFVQTSQNQSRHPRNSGILSLEFSSAKNKKNFDSKREIETDIHAAFLFDEDRRYRAEDLKYDFLALKYTNWIKMSTIGISDEKKGSKSSNIFTAGFEKGWENAVCFGWFLLALIRLLLVIFSFVHFVLTRDVDKELNRVTLLAICSMAFLLLLRNFTYVAHISVHNIVLLLSSMFKYLDDETARKAEGAELRRRPWKSHTFKELLIIYLPFFVYSMMFLIPLLSIVDPSFPLLLVSLVEPEFSLSFVSLAIFDTIIILHFILVIHVVCFITIGMHRLEEEAQLTIKNMIRNQGQSDQNVENLEAGSRKIIVKKAIQGLGLVHIWTHFFNISLTHVVYNAKLIALTASIFGGFGLIKMLEVQDWPYAGTFGLMFLEGIILYNVCFGGAFKIPRKSEELKAEIRKLSYKMKPNSNSNARCRENDLDLDRKYVERVLRSIPWLGVKDGVYKMERMTCVNFFDYVIQQITSLVLTY